jgi:hypothetical protein
MRGNDEYKVELMEAGKFSFAQVICALFECGFIGARVVLAWALHEHVFKVFPLEGPPLWLAYACEVLFSLLTLTALVKFFLRSQGRRDRHYRWWV